MSSASNSSSSSSSSSASASSSAAAALVSPSAVFGSASASASGSASASNASASTASASHQSHRSHPKVKRTPTLADASAVSPNAIIRLYSGLTKLNKDLHRIHELAARVHSFTLQHQTQTHCPPGYCNLDLQRSFTALCEAITPGTPGTGTPPARILPHYVASAILLHREIAQCSDATARLLLDLKLSTKVLSTQRIHTHADGSTTTSSRGWAVPTSDCLRPLDQAGSACLVEDDDDHGVNEAEHPACESQRVVQATHRWYTHARAEMRKQDSQEQAFRMALRRAEPLTHHSHSHHHHKRSKHSHSYHHSDHATDMEAETEAENDDDDATTGSDAEIVAEANALFRSHANHSE